MAKGKVITEDKFERMKKLVDGGATSAQVQKWEQVSEETVRRVKKANSYQDYKDYAVYNHRKGRDVICDTVQEQMQFDALECTSTGNPVVDMIRKVSQEMVCIANDLHLLAEMMCQSEESEQ